MQDRTLKHTGRNPRTEQLDSVFHIVFIMIAREKSMYNFSFKLGGHLVVQLFMLICINQMESGGITFYT